MNSEAINETEYVRWVITLWLLIHGGDPAPDQLTDEVLTVRAISALANTLRNTQARQALNEVLNPLIENFASEGLQTSIEIGQLTALLQEPASNTCFKVEAHIPPPKKGP